MHSTVELLAQSPCAKVTRCEGGHFHLTVGPVTVCMEAEVFRAVALTMRDAAARYEASQGVQCPQVRA